MENSTSKFEEVNTQLCELIGIEQSEFCERTSDLCFKNCPVYEQRNNPEYCTKYLKVYPKLYAPNNFVKLMETKVSGEKSTTIWGLFALNNIYYANRLTALISLRLGLIHVFTEDMKQSIKENLKKQVWFFD